MNTIKGEYNKAVVYAKYLDEGCDEQIRQYLDHPLFADTTVRIMPDAHVGKGATIGFTATCNEYVVPSLIGVDIGCGVSAYNLGRKNIDFDKLDKYIRKYIPAGKDVRSDELDILEKWYPYVMNNSTSLEDFREKVSELASKLMLPLGRVFASLGTLGGGNHFIEIDTDEDKCHWLLVHTGSRNLGASTARYHQNIAEDTTPKNSPIKFLHGIAANGYVDDMIATQLYARVNRALIGCQISCDFLKVAKEDLSVVESVHNYIDFDHGIVRKGAISAQKGERLVIPFSMADGAILGVGKGNAEWNYSAPHGSGRKMSRSRAKELSMDEYRKRMKGVWSSCVGKNTLDESPMAYKKTNDILDAIVDTLEVTNRMFPVYNFKCDKPFWD
ncbi:MAG: RtcB family protein [Puniceicoccales bacterium]|jgi:RNA-splicing ligase RtcB|nr:RtcB family protein [Puniceicoccales bacterium]